MQGRVPELMQVLTCDLHSPDGTACGLAALWLRLRASSLLRGAESPLSSGEQRGAAGESTGGAESGGKRREAAGSGEKRRGLRYLLGSH